MFRLFGTALAAAVTVAVVVAWAPGAVGSTGQAAPILQTVSTQTLAARGITLSAPTATATVSQSSADATAVSIWGKNTQIREQVLADLTDTDSEVSGRLVWVISLMPAGGIWSVGGGRPGAPGPQEQSYLLEFVDAATGQDLYGISGGP